MVSPLPLGNCALLSVRTGLPFWPTRSSWAPVAHSFADFPSTRQVDTRALRTPEAKSGAGSRYTAPRHAFAARISIGCHMRAVWARSHIMVAAESKTACWSCPTWCRFTLGWPEAGCALLRRDGGEVGASGPAPPCGSMIPPLWSRGGPPERRGLRCSLVFMSRFRSSIDCLERLRTRQA